MGQGSTGMAGRALEAFVRPARSVGLVREAVEGVGEIVWELLNPAPETPLNVPIGPHRRFRVVRQELADYKKVKDSLGGTVNDVVLAVVAGALGGWPVRAGSTPTASGRALVPVSVRAQDERGTLGNRLTAMRAPLPVYIQDPAARLTVVSRAMDDLKHSKQAVGASTLVAVNDIAPPAVLAQASRLQFSTRLFNLLVTNIPGPQVPLYILGHQLQDLFPLAFLPQGHALAVAIMSYNGRVGYGLLGDFDALPDIELVAAGIDEALAELLAVAGRRCRAATGAHRRKPSARRRRRCCRGRIAERSVDAPTCGQSARSEPRATASPSSTVRTKLLGLDAAFMIENLICLNTTSAGTKRLPGTYMELPPTPAPVGIHDLGRSVVRPP